MLLPYSSIGALHEEIHSDPPHAFDRSSSYEPIAKKSKCKPTKDTCGANAVGECPKEGCGGDSELNKRKNMVTPAADPEVYGAKATS